CTPRGSVKSLRSWAWSYSVPPSMPAACWRSASGRAISRAAARRDMDRLNAFEEMLSGKEDKLDLARACLMIAQDAYPGLDVERYLGDIERLAIRLRGRVPQSGQAEERVVALNQFFYDELGFWGNTDDYYDPRNSY